MSLEEALAENTAAVKALAAALKGGKMTAADAAIEKEAARATGAKATGKATSTKAKKVTIDTIKERFGGYLGIEDKAERKQRIANVQAMMDHFGVPKASALEEENWVEALGYLKQFEDDETPDFMNEDGADEDDGALV